MTDISIRDLRQNLATVADKVDAGEQFEVYRRSKPAFKIVPVDTPIDDEWETVIDFTEGGKADGVCIEDLVNVASREWTE